MSKSIARSAGIVLALFALSAQAGSYINLRSYDPHYTKTRGSNLAYIQFDGQPMGERMVRAPVNLRNAQLHLPWLSATAAQVQAIEKFEIYGKAEHGRTFSLFQWHRGDIRPGTNVARVSLSVPAEACGQSLKVQVKVVLRYYSHFMRHQVRIITDDLARNDRLSVDCAKPSHLHVAFYNDWGRTFHNHFSSHSTDYSVLQRGAVPGEESCLLSESARFEVEARDDLGIKTIKARVGGVIPRERVFGIRPQRHFRGSWSVRPHAPGPATHGTKINVTAFDRTGAGRNLFRAYQIAERSPEAALRLLRFSPSAPARAPHGRDVVFGGGLEIRDCALRRLIAAERVEIGWAIRERSGQKVASGNIHLRGPRTPFIVRAHAPPTGVYHLELTAKNGGSGHRMRYSRLGRHTITVYPVLSKDKARQIRSGQSGAAGGPSGHFPTPQFGR